MASQWAAGNALLALMRQRNRAVRCCDPNSTRLQVPAGVGQGAWGLKVGGYRSCFVDNVKLSGTSLSRFILEL